MKEKIIEQLRALNKELEELESNKRNLFIGAHLRYVNSQVSITEIVSPEELYKLANFRLVNKRLELEKQLKELL